MSYILNFGRYKNSDIRNIFNKDQDYCKYLFYQPSIKLLYPDIYKFLFNSIYPDNEKEIFMEFGRYKNKPLSYIIKKKDIKYLVYLHSSKLIKDTNIKLFKVLDYIISNLEYNVDY